jgi:hypothetical protein
MRALGFLFRLIPVELSLLSPHGLSLQAQKSENQASRLFPWRRSQCSDFALTDGKKEACLGL